MRKVKKKKTTKKILLLLIPLIIILLVVLNWHTIVVNYQSKVTGYKVDTIEILHEKKIYDKIKKDKYSLTLEKIVGSEYYQEKYLKDYLVIDYQEKEYFLENINKLLDLGYKTDEINYAYSNLSNESITFLTDNDYLKDIINVMKLSYFKEDNLERYLKYNKDKDIGYEDLVTYVNASLDYEYYTNVNNIESNDDLLVLVNKYNKLAEDYAPSDLEAISSKYNLGFNNKMRHVAREAFEKMAEAARNDNIYIYSGSAYRSYSYQANLYNRYVNSNGKANADTFSARAGYSEHQTGLATDIMNKNDYISESDKEYTWLVDNSYKYGFILRYPKGKENITGYMYEEWHFRYVGEEVATKLKELDITYEEYVARGLLSS